MDFDTSSLQSYKDDYTTASNQASQMTNAAPTLLNELKTNLTSIFAKDNPFIAERGQALETYLNAPSQSRVATLPSNMPIVEGSNLNLSPTQQDAITTARTNAALVPLAGLNQIVTGLYGNIPSMVDSAGRIYTAQIDAAKQKAAIARQAYEDAFAELKEREAVRQFNATLAENMRQFDITQRNKAGSGGGGLLDLFGSGNGQSAFVSRSGYFEDEGSDNGFKNIENNGNWYYGSKSAKNNGNGTQLSLPSGKTVGRAFGGSILGGGTNPLGLLTGFGGARVGEAYDNSPQVQAVKRYIIEKAQQAGSAGMNLFNYLSR